ncbi:hypothetical protein Bhyg_06012, partial [Pseudolycoriella hygida]
MKFCIIFAILAVLAAQNSVTAVLCPFYILNCPAGQTLIWDYTDNCCGTQSCIQTTPPAKRGICPLYILSCPAGTTHIYDYKTNKCGDQSCIQNEPDASCYD